MQSEASDEDGVASGAQHKDQKGAPLCLVPVILAMIKSMSGSMNYTKF